MNGGMFGVRGSPEYQSQESESLRPALLAREIRKNAAVNIGILLIAIPALIGRGLPIALYGLSFFYCVGWLTKYLTLALQLSGKEKSQFVISMWIVGFLAWASTNTIVITMLDVLWFPVFWVYNPFIDSSQFVLRIFEAQFLLPAWLLIFRVLAIFALPVIFCYPASILIWRYSMEIVFPMFANVTFKNASPSSLWTPFGRLHESEQAQQPKPKGEPVVFESVGRDKRTIKRTHVDILTKEQWQQLAHLVLDQNVPFSETALTGKGMPLTQQQYRKLKAAMLEAGLLEMVGRGANAGVTLTIAGAEELEKWLQSPSPTP